MIPTRFALPNDLPAKLERAPEPPKEIPASDIQRIENLCFEGHDWTGLAGCNLFGALVGSEEC